MRASDPAGQPPRAHEPDQREKADPFRVCINAVKDYAIFTLDSPGRVNNWNEGAERLKGCTESEVIEKHISLFYPEEDVKRGKPMWELEVAKRGGRVEDEGWRVRKDGSRFWANVIVTATQDRSGRLIGFTKVTRDFTERMQAQEELRKANSKLATSPLLCFSVDRGRRHEDEIAFFVYGPQRAVPLRLHSPVDSRGRAVLSRAEGLCG